MGISKIATTGHWNDGGFLARCIIQFEIFPDLSKQDGQKSQVFRVTREVLDTIQPRAICRATELALSEMAMKIGFHAGPLMDAGTIEHIYYEDGFRPKSEKIGFTEISIG